MNKIIIFFIALTNLIYSQQDIDKGLLDKYEIDFLSRGSYGDKTFFIDECDFCDEFKVELFKAGINLTENKEEAENRIEIEFNALGKSFKILRGWNGKILNRKGDILSVFNVEKKKVIINSRQDYKDRKNCMYYISLKIFESL